MLFKKKEDFIVNLFLKNRKVALLLALLMVILFSFFLTNLKVDSGIQSVTSSSSQIYKDQIKYEKIFNGSEQFIILLSNNDGILTKDSIDAIAQISNEASSIVKSVTNKDAYVFSITSIYNSDPRSLTTPIGSEGNLDVLAEFIENPMLKDMLVSKDKKKSIIAVPISTSISNNEKILNSLLSQIEKRVGSIVSKYPNIEVKFSGIPYIKKNITKFIMKDFLFLFPFSLAFFFLVIWVLYRNFFSSVVSILITVVTIVLVFSIKGLLGSPITIIESSMPIFLIAISSASSMHIMIEIIKFSKIYGPLKAPEKASEVLIKPVILSGLTTAIGFGSLASARTPAIKYLGIFLAIGICISTFLSIYFVPVIASYKNFRKVDINRAKNIVRYNTFIDLLKKIFPVIFLITIGELVFAVFGILNTKSELNELNYFKKNLEIRTTAEEISKTFLGVSNLWMVLQLDDNAPKGNETKIKILRAIDEVSKTMEKEENGNFHRIMSYKTFIESAYSELMKDGKLSLPKEDATLDRIIRIFDANLKVDNEVNRNFKKMFNTYVSEDESAYSVMIYLRSSEKSVTERFVKEIKVVLDKELPPYVKPHFMGEYLKVDIANSIIRDQIISLISSVFLIFLYLSFSFKSIKDGVLVIIPISLSIFLNFGIMWILNIKLNPATAVISSIGMGVGVDYAIHYYHRFISARSEAPDKISAVKTAFRESFKGIFINAISVALGFSALLLSSYEITFQMGLIISLTMLTSFISTILLFPMLLFYFKK